MGVSPGLHLLEAFELELLLLGFGNQSFGLDVLLGLRYRRSLLRLRERLHLFLQLIVHIVFVLLIVLGALSVEVRNNSLDRR